MELKCRVTFDSPQAARVAGWRAFISYNTSSEEDLGQAVRSSSGEAAIQPDGSFSIAVADDVIRAAGTLPDLIARIAVRDMSGSEAGGIQLSGRKLALAVRRGTVVAIELPNSGRPEPSPPPKPKRAIATTVRGRIEIEDRPDQVDGFDGYDVTADFRLRTSGRPGSATEGLTGPNRFALALPERERLAEGDVELTARYPSGIIAGRRTVGFAELDEPAVIRIASPSVRTLTTSSRAAAARLERLKGKVIQLDGTIVPNRQVVLWNSPPGGAPKVVLATRTDQFGGFTAERPPTRFEAVTATVSGTLNASPAAAIGVTLEGQDGAPGGRLPGFIYLVVEGAQAAEKAGYCSCENQAPRLPDQADLTGNPGAYSQDIGGSCTNFTVPNRTLEEFTYSMVVRTTEPVVKGTTVSNLEERDRNLLAYRRIADPTGQKVATAAEESGQANSSAAIDFALLFKALANLSPDVRARLSGRGPLNASNAVDWDSEPTFYQATTIAHGHILSFKQVWKADGYSLGDLLYSLPLAPGQKKQIVVFDWDRTEFGSRDEATHEDEALEAYLSHNRDVLDITQGTVSEQMRGGSESRTSGKAGGIGGGLFGSFFGVAGGFAASSGKTNSSAWQDSSRSTSAMGLGQLRDSVQQGASAVRNQRSTVIQTARQAERFRVETEVVANYNHCHAITVQYFEVLRHYTIEQRLSHVQECLFVPLLMSMFDEAKVIRWFDILKRSLRFADRQTTFRLATGGTAFRKKSLLDAFGAVERRLVDPQGLQQPQASYAAEKVLDLSGDIYITLELNRPVDKAGDAAQADAELAEVLDDLAWNTFFNLLPYGLNELRTKLEKRVRAERDRIFQEELAPEIASKFVALLKFAAIDGDGKRHDLDLDATLVGQYVRGQQLYVSLRPNMAELPLTREQITKFVIFSTIDLSRAARSRVIVNRVTLRYRTARYDGVLIRNDSVNNDLKSAAIPFGQLGGNSIPVDNVVLYTPLNTDEMRNPRSEDIELVQRLLVHLNGNLEYYHQAIWARMDPQRRFMLLDGFVVPNSGGLSVASVVENRVIGVAGNSLIMPVVPGYKLDPNYKLEPELDADGKPVVDAMGEFVMKPIDLLAHYEPVTPTPPFRISVPTRGVFAEAVMGACNSCEKKDETRFWRWEESPLPDQPPAINPVGTQPPQRSEPGSLTPTPFPTPMVNIQNAPAAPEPGVTLGSAMALLGKSDLFRDMAGLDQTQKNALQAMLSNQQSAMHYADKAAELATLGANQRSGGTTIDGIKKSMEDGTLDRETGKKLIEDVYRAQTSGKIASEQPASTAGQAKLADAGAESVKAGNQVKVQLTHPDGTQTVVDQKSTEPVSANGYVKVAAGDLEPVSDWLIEQAKLWPLSNAASVGALFNKLFGMGYLDFFRRYIWPSAEWKAMRGKAGGINFSADARRRFDQICDNIPILFGAKEVSVLDFVALITVFMRESGLNFVPVSEKAQKVGGCTGIDYFFNAMKLPHFNKASYNKGQKWTAFKLFNDEIFMDAHSKLALADSLRGTQLQDWDGATYPPGFPTSEDIDESGVILQADFYKFRGRGFIQTTFRYNYKPLIQYVLNYTGTHPKMVEYRDVWKALSGDLDHIASVSKNADWDVLFQQTDMIIACFAVGVHNKGGGYYTRLGPTAAEINTNDPSDTDTSKGSLENVFRSIAGKSKNDKRVSVYTNQVLRIFTELSYGFRTLNAIDGQEA